MSIEINGVAHVILTVSDFPAARAFYGKPLSLLGMVAVCDTDKFFYCVGGRTAIGFEPCAPGTPPRALCPGACRTAPPVPSRPIPR